jgi:PadR family transcriptional regulator, regulatory protein AphA
MSISICQSRRIIHRMSLRHAVLGLLAVEPATGYDLAQRFDKSLAHAWHASHSQIYPELARLDEEGMVEVVGEGPRRSRTWALTDRGRDELRRFMTETEPSRSQRNETALRWFLVSLLDPADRRIVLEREIAFVTAEREELTAIATAVDALPGGHPFRGTVDLGLRVDAVMLDWLREQLADADAAS